MVIHKTQNMYKYFLVISILISSGSFAQNKKLDMDRENFFRFGAKAGLNANKISGKSYKKGFGDNYPLGWFLMFNFISRFGILPAGSLVQGTAEFTDCRYELCD